MLFLQQRSVVWERLCLNRQYVICCIVGGSSIVSSAAIFVSPSVSWPCSYYVCCWKIRIKNCMSKKKGKEESICTLVEKLKTNHRSWEHNSSHTRHLSSRTPLMFCDFTDKLQEWSNLIEPGQACLCHHKFLCSHGTRSVKLQMRLVKPCAVGITIFNPWHCKCEPDLTDNF